MNQDYAKLSRKALLRHFDQERLEWLEAGMSETEITLIHFGEDGKTGGDYALWLLERKHLRPDHKYCLGTPISIHEADPDGTWIRAFDDLLGDAVAQSDLDRALRMLTPLQRHSFIEVRLKGRTYRDVAQEIGKSFTTIEQAVNGARKKLKNIFDGYTYK